MVDLDARIAAGDQAHRQRGRALVVDLPDNRVADPLRRSALGHARIDGKIRRLQTGQRLRLAVDHGLNPGAVGLGPAVEVDLRVAGLGVLRVVLYL